MSKNRESFYLPQRELRITTDASGSRTVVGTIPYNSPSAGLPWIETIAPGAFADALKPGADVLMLRDHDASLLLGRTTSGTLTLRDSAEGLQFTCRLPNTTTANDLAESLGRKDISGTSFGFITNKDVWADDGKGNLTRVLQSVELFECSICSFPAFPDSTAAIRSVPRDLRPLLKRSHVDGCDCDCSACDAGNCDECEDEDCEDSSCEANGCPNQDEDDDNEDRSSKLTWAERTLLQIEVARRK